MLIVGVLPENVVGVGTQHARVITVSSHQRRAVISIFAVRERNTAANLHVADTLFWRFINYADDVAVSIECILNLGNLRIEVARTRTTCTTRRKHKRLAALDVDLFQTISEPDAVVAVLS